MNFYIAIDVGGTLLRLALFPQDEPVIFAQKTIPTYADVSSSPTQRLIDLVAEMWPQTGKVLSIGIAVPGPCNPFLGVLYRAPNIPTWKNIALTQILTNQFHVPCILGNDANLAALGEWKYGAARGYHDVLYMTISTGIGGGIILDDHLILGVRGLAGELGHITVDPQGPLCSCGHRGHLESFSSGTAIARYVSDQIRQGESSSLSTRGEINARDVCLAANQGDPLARRAFERAGSYLGYAVADFLHAFNPAILVMGGGVSSSGELLFEPMRQAMQKHILSPEYIDDLLITQALLGDHAGLMGALALAQSAPTP
jgi:glucokinase